MNLEMEGGTDARRGCRGGDSARARASALRRFRHRGDPGAAGPMDSVERLYDDAAAAVGVPSSGSSSTSRAWSSASCAAWRRTLYHRRAGFSANGMGVWKVPEAGDPRSRARMASVRGGLALLRAPGPMRTGPTRCSRWPTAGRRRSATQSSSRSPTNTTCNGDCAVLYSSTEFKKIRLHYFTEDYARGGSGERVAADTRTGGPLRARRRALPGGVNSPVRAMRSIGRDHPIFIERGDGFELIDVDGHRYVIGLLVGAADGAMPIPRSSML